jgi:FkbM family methyltransferase
MSWHPTLRRSAKSLLRAALPPSLWDAGKFLYNLPIFWTEAADENFRHRHQLTLFDFHLSDNVTVRCPENLTAYICFRYHFFAKASDGRRELLDFLELSEGCRTLLDVGAQCGIMSAVFARSRGAPHRIVSVEPDLSVLPILQATKVLNKNDNSPWVITNIALGEQIGFVDIPRTNCPYGEERRGPISKTMRVNMDTLDHLIEINQMIPDIIKIDIESFEYEVLMSSWKVIENHRPALHLEVHWELLNDRGKEAEDFLGPLADLGYRGIRRYYRGMDAWRRARSRESVSRIAMRTA